MANTVFKLRRSSVAGKQPNTSTLTIGELGINLTDKILYSSDGGDVFEIGANNTNVNVSNTLTVNKITANGSLGTAGKVLTSNSIGGVYWATSSGGGGSVNADAQYTWTNTQTFQNTITFSSTINGTVNNATYLTGNSVSDLNTYASDKAANAYSNATSYADTKAGTAYSNATSYADTKAGTAYTNATSYTDTKIGTANTAITGNAATAYTNAVSYTDTKILTANGAITGNAATAYTNAVSYTDARILTANGAITGNAATAYTNAVSYTDGKILTANSAITGNADTAYANAIAYSGNAVAAYTNAVSYTDGKILTANGAITGNAATAYSNSVSYIDGKILTANGAITGNAATAYTNAVSYVDTKIGTANTAITGNAATAYTNAVSYVDTKIATANSAITGNAATAYTNAVSYTDTKISTANTAMAANAAAAYTNAIAIAANATNLTSGTVAEARLPFRMNQNVSTTNNVTFANIALTGGTISTTPSNSTDIVNKQYADAIATGINYHTAVRLVTNTDLGTVTYNNGTSGVGATLTKTTTFAALSIDSVTAAYLDRILVRAQTNTALNGIYSVTNTGSVSTAWVLTRATDYDQVGTGTNEIDKGDFTYVLEGTAGAGTAWIENSTVTTIGTDAITFIQFSSKTLYALTAGTGLFYSSGAAYDGTAATTFAVNSSYIATISSNNASFLGGTAAASYQLNSTLSANVATLTANNTSYVGSVTAANVVSNAQLSGNLSSYQTTAGMSSYQTTAGLSANVATLTTNNTSFVGSVTAANVVSNNQLSSNLANYQTTAGLSANVATLSSNNASYLGTVAAASYVQNTDSRTLSGNLNFTGTNNYFSNAVYVGPNVSVNTTSVKVGNSTFYGNLINSQLSLIAPTTQTTVNTSQLSIYYPTTANVSISDISVGNSATYSSLSSGSLVLFNQRVTTSFPTQINMYNINDSAGTYPGINFNKGRLTGSGNTKSGDILGDINFYGSDDTAAGPGFGGVSGALIRAQQEADYVSLTGTVATRLTFTTSDNAGNTLERLRISSNGNIGIGNTTPTNLLSVSGTTYYGGNVVLGSSSLAVGLQANGGYGTAGQVLTSNGTATYWAAAAADTVNNANHVVYANYRTVTASPNTVIANDSLILVNMTANSTINLPAASTTNGSIINIKNINTGYVSIIPNGSDTIDGQANLVIQYRYSAAGLISTSTGWAIV